MSIKVNGQSIDSFADGKSEIYADVKGDLSGDYVEATNVVANLLNLDETTEPESDGVAKLYVKDGILTFMDANGSKYTVSLTEEGYA